MEIQPIFDRKIVENSREHSKTNRFFTKINDCQDSRYLSTRDFTGINDRIHIVSTENNKIYLGMNAE